MSTFSRSGRGVNSHFARIGRACVLAAVLLRLRLGQHDVDLAGRDAERAARALGRDPQPEAPARRRRPGDRVARRGAAEAADELQPVLVDTRTVTAETFEIEKRTVVVWRARSLRSGAMPIRVGSRS